jgi:hypothetical protein
VPYPTVPTFSIRTLRGVLGLVVFVGLIFGMIFLPKDFFFPVGMLYVTFGVVSSFLKGLLDRQMADDGIDSDDDEDLFGERDDDTARELAEAPKPHRRRRFRGPRRKPDRIPPEEPPA